MGTESLPHDIDNGPKPKTPIDESKNPQPQIAKIERQPDGTQIEKIQDKGTDGKVL